MPKPIEGTNVNVLIEPDMLAKIEAFRWSEKLPSKTAAIRELIDRGLKVKRPARRAPSA
jgi:hypothetical protein